jgi:hypothetical protein
MDSDQTPHQTIVVHVIIAKYKSHPLSCFFVLPCPHLLTWQDAMAQHKNAKPKPKGWLLAVVDTVYKDGERGGRGARGVSWARSQREAGRPRMSNVLFTHSVAVLSSVLPLLATP